MTLATKLLVSYVLPIVLWFAASVSCQANSSLVFRATGLSQALAMDSIATVAVSGIRLF